MDAETVKQTLFPRRWRQKLRIFKTLSNSTDFLTARQIEPIVNQDTNLLGNKVSLTLSTIERFLYQWATTPYVESTTVTTNQGVWHSKHQVRAYRVNAWACFWHRIENGCIDDGT